VLCWLLVVSSGAFADGLVTIGLDSNGSPVVAMNHRGDLLVAWESAARNPNDAAQLAGIIDVRFKPARGPWQPVRSLRVPLDHQSEASIEPVKAVLSDRDRGVVLLDSGVPPVRVLWFSPRQQLRLDLPDGHAKDLPGDIAGNGAGDVALTWLRYRHIDESNSLYGFEGVRVATLGPGAREFGPPVTVANGHGQPSGAVVGVDAHGDVTAAWEAVVHRGKLCCVVVMSITRPATARPFERPAIVGRPSVYRLFSEYEEPPPPLPRPSLAVAPSGAAVISYTHTADRPGVMPGSPPLAGVDYVIDNEAVYRPSGGRFGAASPLEPEGQQLGGRTEAWFDPDGSFYFGWNPAPDLCSESTGDSNLWLARRTAGGLVTQAHELPRAAFDGPYFTVDFPLMAFGRGGRALVVFGQANTAQVVDPATGYVGCAVFGSQVEIAKLRPDGTATTAAPISPAEVSSPVVADSGTGKIAIAWGYAPVGCGDPRFPDSAIQVRTIGLAAGRDPYPGVIRPDVSRFDISPGSTTGGVVSIRLTSSQPGIATLIARRQARRARTVRLRLRVHRGVNVIHVSTGRLAPGRRAGRYALRVTVTNAHGGTSPQCDPNPSRTLQILPRSAIDERSASKLERTIRRWRQRPRRLQP
jgi:hypothetical protein